MDYERISPVCASTAGPSVGVKRPKFVDGRCGKYRPSTNVMATFAEHGFVAPTVARMIESNAEFFKRIMDDLG